jgi:outer membrane protein
VSKKLAWWLLPMMMLVSGTAAAELKIAVLNLERAIGDSDEAKAAMEKIQKEIDPERVQIKTLNDDITALQDRLQKDREVISDSERRKIESDIQSKQMDGQFRVQKLQKEVQDKQQEVLSAMGPRLDAVLKDMIEIEGYDFIVQRQSVLYVNAKHDITRRVTEKLNDKKTGAAPAAKPTPKTP